MLNRKQFMVVAAVAASAVIFGGRAAYADDACELVARFSRKAVSATSLSACRRGYPVACAVAAADKLVGNRAEKGLVKGCRWFITKVKGSDDLVEVRFRGTRSAVAQPYQELLEVQKELERQRALRKFKWLLRKIGFN